MNKTVCGMIYCRPTHYLICNDIDYRASSFHMGKINVVFLINEKKEIDTCMKKAPWSGFHNLLWQADTVESVVIIFLIFHNFRTHAKQLTSLVRSRRISNTKL